MCFTFMKIHFILKLMVATTIVICFGWISFVFQPLIFECGSTINPGFDPNLAHFLSVLTVMLILHFVDRQMEYISRVDYK